MTREEIGKIGTHKRHPERLALVALDGQPAAWFARDWTRERVAEALHRAGCVVDEAGNVSQITN